MTENPRRVLNSKGIKLAPPLQDAAPEQDLVYNTPESAVVLVAGYDQNKLDEHPATRSLDSL